jgi:hypothetical protein
MPKMMTCEACGATAPNAWSDEKMLEEFYRLHPGVSTDDMAVICDDCHQIEIKLGLVNKGPLQ